MIMKLIFAILL